MAADITFDYDAELAWLIVTVDNTTAKTPGAKSPAITRVLFNAPADTVTAAALIAQWADGPIQPAFALQFDADAADGTDPNAAACLGTFNFELATTGPFDGIAPKNASAICGRVAAPFLVRPTFVIGLHGPDVHGLTSEVFQASFSRNGGDRAVNVAVGFDGADCEGNTLIGNAELCNTAVFLRGFPRIGDAIAICVEGGNQCRSFLGVSAEPGPEDFKFLTLPIGVPVLWTYDFGYFPIGGSQFVMPLQIPLDVSLVGVTLYWTSMTHPYMQFGPYSFAPRFEFTVLDEGTLPPSPGDWSSDAEAMLHDSKGGGRAQGKSARGAGNTGTPPGPRGR